MATKPYATTSKTAVKVITYASDETAVMAPSESVDTISHAVSQAAEQVERARAAIRALSASIGMS